MLTVKMGLFFIRCVLLKNIKVRSKLTALFYVNVESNSVIWCHLVLRLIVCNRGF